MPPVSSSARHQRDASRVTDVCRREQRPIGWGRVSLDDIMREAVVLPHSDAHRLPEVHQPVGAERHRVVVVEDYVRQVPRSQLAPRRLRVRTVPRAADPPAEGEPLRDDARLFRLVGTPPLVQVFEQLRPPATAASHLRRRHPWGGQRSRGGVCNTRARGAHRSDRMPQIIQRGGSKVTAARESKFAPGAWRSAGSRSTDELSRSRAGITT